MAFDLVTIPCLSDNYAFLLRDHDSGAVALIDVPEAAPIMAELDRRGWTLSQVWLTSSARYLVAQATTLNHCLMRTPGIDNREDIYAGPCVAVATQEW